MIRTLLLPLPCYHQLYLINQRGSVILSTALQRVQGSLSKGALKDFTPFAFVSSQKHSAICWGQGTNRSAFTRIGNFSCPYSLFSLKFLLSADMSSYPFAAEYAKRGQAKCKKCKEKCEKDALRIGKLVSNPFSDSGEPMKQWFHVDCIFESFKRARATTKKIDDGVEDIEGWEDLEEEDKKKIRGLIDDMGNNGPPKKATPKKPAAAPKPSPSVKQAPKGTSGGSSSSASQSSGSNPTHKDNSFREFRRLCALVADEPSYLGKTALVSKFLKYGTNKEKFEGDLRLFVKLLLPGVIKRVYNLQNKQLVKLFSQLFGTNLEEMIEHLEQGDVAETIREFFEQSDDLPPTKKCVLSIQDVDQYLEELAGMTREEEQSYLLKKIAKKCTANDLKMIVRLIKGDLRINAGAKHILEAVHSDAYEAFQTSRNIDAVLDQVIKLGSSGGNLKLSAQLMTPVLPMLAEACKSVDYAFKKCPSGVMYAEIKYDGERVQVHKKDNQFLYFSRSLKPVMPHKVSHFKEYIPKAFPFGSDLILDAEVLMICTKTGNPLPFGTLGVHKKEEFKDANVCLFVFDCIHYNGEDLMDRPISERRKILEKNMTEIENHVMFSEMKVIRRKDDLRDMINHVLKQGLEGLVLKDYNSIYEPGKRHWLKVKKDYLNEGAMADSADLVVLGAWYGSGKKGGMMSVFLMGCYDARIKKWCTVTKVHTGHDDETLARLQKELDMVKISQDADRVPSWLKCTKTMIPDFVAADPKKSPVWEITGAEFTRHDVHTADGISIRFPRVTKVRDDKTWEEATSLSYLQDLYKNSRENANFEGLASDSADKTDDDDSGKKSGGSGCSTPVRPTPGGGGGGTSNTNSPSSSVSLSPRVKVQRKLAAFACVKEESPPRTYVDVPRVEEKGKSEKKSEKRKTESDDGNRRKKKCKYGEACYNDNEAHLMMYDHPVVTGVKHPTKNPLPDVFNGVHVSIPSNIDKIDVLKRYIIAYGGEVVPEFRLKEATHHVVESKDDANVSGNGITVTPAWLWDSIKLKRLQATKPYILR